MFEVVLIFISISVIFIFISYKLDVQHKFQSLTFILGSMFLFFTFFFSFIGIGEFSRSLNSWEKQKYYEIGERACKNSSIQISAPYWRKDCNKEWQAGYDQRMRDLNNPGYWKHLDLLEKGD